MQNLLTPEYFLSDEIWQAERERIFFKQWQYAGHTAELARNNDWVLANIAGREVVVQNFGGELRAFSNVCSHRFSAIRTKPCGNGPLQCPYHQWTYNKEGLPFGIPLRHQFAELNNPDATKKLALERWSVDRCGGLVFVRLAGEGQSLREFLGATYERLQAASEPLSDVALDFDDTIDANWKLVIQNTLELYHIVAVHPRSFGKGIAYKQLDSQRMVDEIVAPPHIVYRTDDIGAVTPPPAPSSTGARLRRLRSSALQPMKDWVYRRVRRKLSTGLFTPDRKLHHFGIFPCFNFVMDGSSLVTEIVYTPLSAEKTRLRVRIWMPAMEDLGLIERAAMRWLKAGRVSMSLIVADEDTLAAETVQRGLHNKGAVPTSAGLFNEGEQLAHRFQGIYLEQMAKTV